METTALNQLSRQFLGGFPAVEMPSSTTAWPSVGNRSTEQLPADRTQLEVAHFPLLDHQDVLDRFTDLRMAFFEGGVG